MRLIVAEKPSVARDIARALTINGRGNGYIGNGDIRVTWCVGHLVELADPASYDERWRSWSLDTLPMLPEKFALKPRNTATDQWRVVRDLLRGKEVNEVVNACDAGREGELIFAYTYDLAGCRAPVQRLWISSMTDSAIKQGFASLRPGTELANLADAARCRSEADWLVGLNATRAMTARHRGGGDGPLLSVGRVQTPTLALMARREDEIEAFEPRKFWQIKVVFDAGKDPEGEERGTYDAVWNRPGRVKDKEDQDRLYDKAEAEAVVARTAGQQGVVSKVQRKQSKEQPPLLYDLTTAQKEANKRFGFTAKHTLELLQSLYETHKVLTYPRTDSRHLTTDQVETLPRALGGINFGRYQPFAQGTLDQWPVKLTKRVVDDAEVSDHHAIIPTGEDPRRKNLNLEEKRLFDLIARRFLAVFQPPAVFANANIETTITTQAELNNETEGKPVADLFKSRGRTCLDLGWRAVDPPHSKKKDLLLPPVDKGDTVVQKSHKLHGGETKPPKRYNEATLLAAMEHASDQVDEAELKRAMKRNGLGTPATRAAIIETLLRRDYVTRIGKDIVATPWGRGVLKAIPVEALTSPRLTGAWEARLVALAEGGDESRERFMADVRAFTAQIVEAVRSTDANSEAIQAAIPPPDGDVLGECPRCNKEVRQGRRGWRCVGCSLSIPASVARRDVSPQMAKTLLKEGKTKTVKGFTSREGKKFSAALALSDQGVSFVFQEAETLGACPACGQPVRRRGKVVTCDTGRECRFVIFEEMGGFQVTEADILGLLNGQPSRLEWRGDRVVATEKDERELAGPVGACPECPGHVEFGGGRWICLQCRFGLDAEVGGRAFTSGEMAVLLKEKRTPRLHGFRQRSGAVFKAAILLNGNNRYQFDYAKPEGESDAGMTCPICVRAAEPHPGKVISGRAAWGCSRWREGCRFRLPFEIRGIRLEEDAVERLVGKHAATKYLKGFEGLTRSARVVITDGDPCWALEERTTKKKA